MRWGYYHALPKSRDPIAERAYRMTVGELQKKLTGLDPKTYVMVSLETDRDTTYFEVNDVAIAKGQPSRDPDTHKGGFKFDRDGPTEWLFISIEEA